ncbi:MAG: hypothetical protein CMM90_05475 [Rickettsiales bacterium]|nr:hypothetical protein [Rickettsiales bacterium]
MINLLRDLRHHDSLRNLLPWDKMGIIYRFIIQILPFNLNINQFITKNLKFKLHARFAFSNFKSWGNKHNNFFPIYLRLSRESDCFFDIGAHIGIVTLAVAKNIKKNGVIYAFEPSKVNLKFLKYHIACNKIKNVKIVDKLVSSSEKKKIIFYESPESSGMNSIVSLKKKNITNKNFPKSITLDTFCKNNNIYPDIIKVDIEGSEIEMLMGTKKILKKYRPLIFLSYHPYHLQKLGYQKKSIFDILESLDYKIYDLNGKKPLILKNAEYLLIHKKRNLDNVFKEK